MSRENQHEFSPGQRVKFRVFPEDGRPIKRQGVVTGPDTENPGQMLIQADRIEAETQADPENANPAPCFSVWWAKGDGLVCGPAAPTSKKVSGTMDSDTAPGEPSKAVGSRPCALVHRGPHSQAVVDLVVKIFGGQAVPVTEVPMRDEDGTTVYAFQTTAEDLPKLLAAIEADPSAAQHLAIVEDPENDQLDEMNAEREWPTLTAPAGISVVQVG